MAAFTTNSPLLASSAHHRAVTSLRPRVSRPPQRRPPRASLPDPDVLGAQWNKAGITPLEVIEHALRTFGNDVAIAFSGAEDVVLIEYAKRTKLPFRVFALDTGRLHPETYRFFKLVEDTYNIRTYARRLASRCAHPNRCVARCCDAGIEYTFPESAEVSALVSEKGLFSFYEDGHQECCRIRKVRPLRKKLATLRAWITGQRKDQSPGTRTSVPLLQCDPTFLAADEKAPLFKYNPLANTSSEEVWATIRFTEVPYNTLHEKGFVSIGCEPCTRPVLPNQHEREGRWWWEDATQKECGLHKGNLETEDAQKPVVDSDSIVAHI